MPRFLLLLVVTVLGLSGPPVHIGSASASALAPKDVRATTRVVSAVPVAPITRIMLVGDSITHGTGTDYTWRYRLARHLTVGQARFDLVGPRNDLYLDSHTYADPGFDQDHAAFWGKLLSEAVTTIQVDAATYRPDVIVLLAGTNDVNSGHSTATIEADLNTFITNARAGNPAVTFVIGTVMPTNGVVDPTGIADYNARIPVVAAQRALPESPIIVVDTFTAINAVTDLYDGVHPNPIGEIKIADVFYPAVRSLLRVAA